MKFSHHQITVGPRKQSLPMLRPVAKFPSVHLGPKPLYHNLGRLIIVNVGWKLLHLIELVLRNRCSVLASGPCCWCAHITGASLQEPVLASVSWQYQFLGISHASVRELARWLSSGLLKAPHKARGSRRQGMRCDLDCRRSSVVWISNISLKLVFQ